LERLRGAARAAQPCTKKIIFEMGHTVMNSHLTLLEVYKNQVTLILKHPTLTMQVNREDNTIMFCFL
jgi:hypothetical protein